MRHCFTCGQEFQTWRETKAHLERVHKNFKFVHQHEGTAAFAIESDGSILRFKKDIVKREKRV